MITKSDAIKKASEKIKEIRKNNLREYEKTLASAYGHNPRLAEIDTKLGKIGAQLALLGFSGNTEKLKDLSMQSHELAAEKLTILHSEGVTAPVYDCQLCSDEGYINGKPCECLKKLARQMMIKEMSDEFPLQSCRFETFNLKFYPDTEDENNINPRKKMTQLFKLCCEYALKFDPATSPNLLFMGAAGLGKTHLTLSIVSAVLEKGFQPVYGSASNIFGAIEREYFGEHTNNYYDICLNSDLLVIDDLGTEFVTQYTQSVLYNLINTRLLKRRPTIINTNLSMAEIDAKYTARISSRLIGEYDFRKFFGKDIRQQKLLQ